MSTKNTDIPPVPDPSACTRGPQRYAQAYPALAATGEVLARVAGLQHYLLAPMDSERPEDQRIIVVDPAVATPTFLASPGARVAITSNVLALLVGSLEALTAEVRVAATGVATSAHTLRAWPEPDRAASGWPHNPRIDRLPATAAIRSHRSAR